VRRRIVFGDVAVPAFADDMPFCIDDQRTDGDLVVLVARALGERATRGASSADRLTL
jgi:hypothetical protein